MSDLYTKTVLTVIAVSTSAIALKLYSPDANRIGVHLGAPTRADLAAATERGSPALEELLMNLPLVWVRHGEVSIDGPVQVEGEVRVDGPVEIAR